MIFLLLLTLEKKQFLFILFYIEKFKKTKKFIDFIIFYMLKSE